MMSEARTRGAEWRIWDLHVHTPCSLVNNYGGDTDETWASYLDDLENLPSDIRVIGINDYWFLDGYKRVREAKASGRLPNLEVIFPVLELRLEQFGGTDGNLRRVNLHVIFDPELDPHVIEQQFMSALSARFSLDPGVAVPTWSGAITRESLAALGRAIKASVPAERLPDYQSDLIEGFNNLNVPIDRVREALNSSFLRGRALVGVGKAEWAQIKWNDQSIASKKTIINDAEFVFTAYQDTSKWAEHVQMLRDSNVNHKILDCSDAHALSTTDQHERLGQCATWMNTTPTLAGLKHALTEFDRRVYVGLEPPILGRIRRHPERFIERVAIGAEDPTKHSVFNYELPLNSGFVAVVGNKGQGKSALLDCIALGGNSPRINEFAFLNPQRFLSANNRSAAKEYHVGLGWATGATRRKALTDGHDRSVPVQVEYLPQKFVERVCTADAASGEADEFERELREVLFTHIPEDERSGEKSFDALLVRKTRASKDLISRLQTELRPLIERYVSLADLRASEDVADIDARIALVTEELQRAEDALRVARESLSQADEESGSDAALTALREQARELAASQRKLNEERADLERTSASDRQRRLDMDSVHQRAEDLRRSAQLLNAEAERVFQTVKDGEQNPDDNGASRPLVSVEIDEARLSTWLASIDEAETDRRARRRAVDEELTELASRIAEVDAELAAADSVSELARQRVLQSEERLTALRGSAEDPASALGLRALRERAAAAPDAMREVIRQLVAKARAIHEAYSSQLQEVEVLYGPASDFIANSEVVSNAGLEFRAELRVTQASRNFASSLDGRKSPDLQESLARFPERVAGDDWQLIAEALTDIMVRLEHDKGDQTGGYRHPSTALRTNVPLTEYLVRLFDLSWLEVRFGLTGDGLPLSKLSPGQRGLVLVLFYLVVDRRATPLLLDQPEENLDNATIAHLLVPAIHEAAGRRQTIVVTHNANLAVVGDADQVVHCQWQAGEFHVEAGCISEFDVASFAVDILEGTKPAFNRRRDKYAAFPELQ